jgi:hypothetical protein
MTGFNRDGKYPLTHEARWCEAAATLAPRAIQPFNLPPLKASAWQAGSSILQPFFIIHPSNNGLD